MLQWRNIQENRHFACLRLPRVSKHELQKQTRISISACQPCRYILAPNEIEIKPPFTARHLLLFFQIQPPTFRIQPPSFQIQPPPFQIQPPRQRRQLSEFGEKKDVARVLEQKELKVASLGQEVNGLRSQVRSKDRIIFGFKRELSSMVHISLPKDLEQAVKVRARVRARAREGGWQNTRE